jgi:hypothetical protein
MTAIDQKIVIINEGEDVAEGAFCCMGVFTYLL